MKILLDTHIFLWALSAPEKISKEKRLAVESRANSVYVSSVSIAEIMIKASLGKLNIAFNPVEEIENCGFEPLPFTCADAVLLKDMPFHHRDPFDRMLIAQGQVHGFSIMTNDPKFKEYDCKLI